jgi:hypothetical protein
VRAKQVEFNINDATCNTLLEIFDLIDTCANGRLTLTELKPVLAMVSLGENQQFELFHKIDEDASGKIDFAEFCELIKLMGEAYSANNPDNPLKQNMQKINALTKFGMKTRSIRSMLPFYTMPKQVGWGQVAAGAVVQKAVTSGKASPGGSSRAKPSAKQATSFQRKSMMMAAARIEVNKQSAKAAEAEVNATAAAAASGSGKNLTAVDEDEEEEDEPARAGPESEPKQPASPPPAISGEFAAKMKSRSRKATTVVASQHTAEINSAKAAAAAATTTTAATTAATTATVNPTASANPNANATATAAVTAAATVSPRVSPRPASSGLAAAPAAAPAVTDCRVAPAPAQAPPHTDSPSPNPNSMPKPLTPTLVAIPAGMTPFPGGKMKSGWGGDMKINPGGGGGGGNMYDKIPSRDWDAAAPIVRYPSDDSAISAKYKLKGDRERGNNSPTRGIMYDKFANTRKHRSGPISTGRGRGGKYTQPRGALERLSDAKNSPSLFFDYSSEEAAGDFLQCQQAGGMQMQDMDDRPDAIHGTRGHSLSRPHTRG